jgi:DNA-binding NtrC family response regulator
MSAKKNLLIFVVEDNKIYNHLVSEFLKKKKIEIKSFYNGKECLSAVKDGEIPDIIIQDYFLEDITGIEVLKQVKKISHKTEFIFLTGNENMEVAVNTIKYGAYDYIIKDELALDRVVDKIHKIVKLFELEKKNNQIKKAMIGFLVVVVVLVIFAILYFVADIF